MSSENHSEDSFAEAIDKINSKEFAEVIDKMNSKEFAEVVFDIDFAEELEETNKLLNDLSKDLKTKAIENIDFNNYFDKIDEEYIKSIFVRYIKDFIDNYHDESDEPFNYIENDIIFRMAIVLGILETKIKRPSKCDNVVIPLEFNNNSLLTCERISNSCWNFSPLREKSIPYYRVFEENLINIQLEMFYSYHNYNIDFEDLTDNLKSWSFNSCSYKLILPDAWKTILQGYQLMRIYSMKTFKVYKFKNTKILDDESQLFRKLIHKITNYETSNAYNSKEFEDLLISEINSLLLTISDYKLPTFSKFSLEGLNFQKFKNEIELKKQELNHSIEEIENNIELKKQELNLKNKSIEDSISTNLKRNEELENQIKNKEIQIYNLNKQIDDLEQTYKSFKRFEDFQGFFEDTSVSEYQKLKQVEHDYQEYQKRSDEMKAYDEIIQNFEMYRNNFLVKSRDYSKLMKKHFQEKNEKLKIKEEELEKEYQKSNEKLISLKEKLELKYKQKSENLEKSLHKAINDANDKQKYWQNIIDHAEDHITSKLQKQLQEQISQFSKFNSAKWDSQVSFNIISTILKSINHKGDLIRLGIKTDELEFKNLNEVLKCIQIFNMFGLCTNDKNENILMNKFTFNFIDKINSYMKQFSVLDPDYKK